VNPTETTWLTKLARPEIAALSAYQPARWEPSLDRLHANESPWRAAHDDSSPGLNRYPEPYHDALDAKLAAFFGVAAGGALATRGSDEGIDLLLRAFCRAGEDTILVCPPTFGMYAASAGIQGARVVAVPLLLEAGFRLDVPGVLAAAASLGASLKLVFLCSPNNPTGNRLAEADVIAVVEGLAERALVVVDEAYVEFADAASFVDRLADFPHVVVLRTFSKARALAGARVGVLLAAPEIVDLARKVLPPYALTQPSIEVTAAALGEAAKQSLAARVAAIRAERARLAAALERSPRVARVWPSEGNFLLCRLVDPAAALLSARAAGLLVRDFQTVAGLAGCVRVTVGTPEQNDRLLGAWS
jgi:histidinol-phosphate aminotransferase